MTRFDSHKAHSTKWEYIGYNEHKVMDAWERFLTGELQSEHVSDVRSIIHESWDRSISKGIDAQNDKSPEILDKYQIEDRKEKFYALLDASQQAFANIGKRLNGTNAMLILTDSQGTIIDEIGDKTTMFAGRDINLTVGSNWNENVIGTNGIGTTLCTGKPTFVHAAEHYCLGIKAWTCAGAPIRDPGDGTVIGVIDLSGPSEIFQPYTAALIAEAAREIEEALAQRNYKDQLKLLEAFFTKLGSCSDQDDLILLDQYGRIAFCQSRAGKLSTKGNKIDLYPGARLINHNLTDTMTSKDISSALPATLRDCTIDVLRKDGVKGAMLVFANKHKNSKTKKRDQTKSKLRVMNKDMPQIIGEYPPLLEAIETVKRLANSSAQMAVLIEGETGVGKELFVEIIHYIIKQKNKSNIPFITLNCGAIAKDLFGSELFGHEAGSFTGALKEGKVGKFELANGGVLCLDEIGELPLDIQSYLLRVLEERVVYRIGADEGRPLSITLVASTNRILKNEVQKGLFRQDLYYRISSVRVSIPPLREREDDIMLLAEYFNQKMSELTDISPLVFTRSARKIMLAYYWPGNVRELKNVIERLHILLPHRKVTEADLPMELFEECNDDVADQQEVNPVMLDNGSPGPTKHKKLASNLEPIEKEVIIQALVDNNGNFSQVARQLGISRPTLYRKLELYKIKRYYS